MEGSFPSETKKKETAPKVRAMDVGTLTTLGTFAHTNWRKFRVVNLDRLALYEGTTQNEQPLGGSRRSGSREIT
jgi:hypothetical protein